MACFPYLNKEILLELLTLSIYSGMVEGEEQFCVGCPGLKDSSQRPYTQVDETSS